MGEIQIKLDNISWDFGGKVCEVELPFPRCQWNNESIAHNNYEYKLQVINSYDGSVFQFDCLTV